MDVPKRSGHLVQSIAWKTEVEGYEGYSIAKRISVVADAPTAHEQLESPPLLREWLQTRASPQEFTEIWQYMDA